MSTKDLRQFLHLAKTLGFDFVGFDGSNHVRLQHTENGATYSAPFTPSDVRSRRNTLSDLERISGRKLARPNAGHYTHRPVPVLDTTLSPAEKRATTEVDELLREADELRRSFDALVAEGTHRAAFEARKTLTRYEEVRERLADLHRDIASINGFMKGPQ